MSAQMWQFSLRTPARCHVWSWLDQTSFLPPKRWIRWVSFAIIRRSHIRKSFTSTDRLYPKLHPAEQTIDCSLFGQRALWKFWRHGHERPHWISNIISQRLYIRTISHLMRPWKCQSSHSTRSKAEQRILFVSWGSDAISAATARNSDEECAIKD